MYVQLHTTVSHSQGGIQKAICWGPHTVQLLYLYCPKHGGLSVVTGVFLTATNKVAVQCELET